MESAGSPGGKRASGATGSRGALARRGIGKGDTVAVMAANTPEMLECHFGVPMAGAVLNTLNVRLDARVHRLHAGAWRSESRSR